MYMGLAEALGAPLITTDGRIGRVHGVRCRVEVFAT
jgi:predicted nucleic acid-binding protein